MRKQSIREYKKAKKDVISFPQEYKRIEGMEKLMNKLIR